MQTIQLGITDTGSRGGTSQEASTVVDMKRKGGMVGSGREL